MEILPFDFAFLPQAAALFVEKFKRLRRAVACLPATLREPQPVIEWLAYLTGQHPAVMALENGRLVGYLAAWLIDDFRSAGRKAAYSPEWGHATPAGWEQCIYPALYRAVGEDWTAAGCQAHAITLLASDQPAERTWFWNGFGLIVVDAVRLAHPLGLPPASSNFTFRKVTTGEISILCTLDDEHWRHYTRSPIFMPPRPAWEMDEANVFLDQPHNSVWLALDGKTQAGFMRLASRHADGADILEAESVINITGAYVRPAYRGGGIATHLLEHALQAYASLGFTCCAVDFESANPEAAAFWPRFFESVCYSLMRVPECIPPPI
jgi:GNAT superfamily N-acetyltransferase